MPPQSRGPSASMGISIQSKSTPDLSTLRRISMTSEAASKPDPNLISPSDSNPADENAAPEPFPSDSDELDENTTKTTQHFGLRRHHSHQPSRFNQAYLHPSS